MRSQRGIALLIALMALVLVGSLGALAARAAVVRSRIAVALRWQEEAAIVVASALAVARIADSAALHALADGASLHFAPVPRPDGWQWHADGFRRGAVIRLLVSAERRSADSTLLAAAQRSLLLVHNSADTVGVLRQHPRF